MELLKLTVVLVLIIFALRKKISVGLTLFGAGLITAILFQVPLDTLVSGFGNLLISWRLISLLMLVILISLLGSLLKELAYLDRLSQACLNLPGGQRTAVAVLPGLIGLMPMPGGSLLSAPLVDNVIKEQKFTGDFKTAANYWFRHLVEFFWPIYAGIFLTEAITGLPIYKVSLMQLPLAVVMVIAGLWFFIRKIQVENNSSLGTFRSIGSIVSSIWPIGLAIILYGFLKIELVYALVISIVILLIASRPKKEVIVYSLKTAFSIKMIFLIFGILSFQMIIELTGSIETITGLAVSNNLPPEIIIFTVCFTVGILTGLVAAYVGLGYSILAGFLYQPEIIPGYIFLAYLSGFVGIMLSPSHLCLVLTNEYFNSNLFVVYKRLLAPLIILFISGLLLYYFGWGTLFN